MLLIIRDAADRLRIPQPQRRLNWIYLNMGSKKVFAATNFWSDYNKTAIFFHFIASLGSNPSREAASILSGKYRRFTFVHPVMVPTFHNLYTRWTNVNLLRLTNSIETTSLKGLTLWYPEISQSKQPLDGDADFHGWKTMAFHGVPCTILRSGQIQGC